MREKYIVRSRDSGPCFACGIRRDPYVALQPTGEFMIAGPRSRNGYHRMLDIILLFEIEERFLSLAWNQTKPYKTSKLVLRVSISKEQWERGLRMLWDAGYSQERVGCFRRLTR